MAEIARPLRERVPPGEEVERASPVLRRLWESAPAPAGRPTADRPQPSAAGAPVEPPAATVRFALD